VGKSRVSKLARTVTAACLLCSIPIQGISATTHLEQVVCNLLPAKPHDPLPALAITPFVPAVSYENALDALRDLIKDADDPLVTTRQFFQTFLAQLNAQNGSSITMEEACRQLRENKNVIPAEYQKVMAIGLDTIESHATSIHHILIPPELAYIRGPWDWHKSDIKEFWGAVKDQWRGFQEWLLGHEEELKQSPVLSALGISAPTAILIFAFFAASITLVAIFNGPAVPATGEIFLKAIPLLINL
jgi:hypothetical protein